MGKLLFLLTFFVLGSNFLKFERSETVKR